MKKYSLSVLFFALCMLVTATGAATIVAPGYPQEEILPRGSAGVFPVSVGGLTNAQGVHFNLTFDSALLLVENVSANSAIPGSTVTTNIDNETGWMQVAVTNTAGITVNETWPLTPLVDITFRSTGSEGVSAMVLAGTPTYSQGEGFMPVDFDWAYSGSIAVRSSSTIRAPSGTLAYGQPGTFAVGVNNLTGATKIWFELMYDGSCLIIDDIASALPGAVITEARADNGIHKFEPFALESVPEEVRLELQQYPHGNTMQVTLDIPGGLATTGYTDVINITFWPTNRTGTSDLEFYWGCTYQDESGSTQFFDHQIFGQIVTSGGGSYPDLGEFKAPSGTIDVMSQKVLPVMVRSLENAKEVFAWTQWNPAIINVTSVSLNATARDAGVTLDWSYVISYTSGNISTRSLSAYLGNMTNLNTTSWIPLLDVTMQANVTSGWTPMNISGASYTIPRENVSIGFSAASLENGQISIVATPADIMQIDLGDIGATKGQTTEVSLIIRNASAITSGVHSLIYDPAVVTVDSVNFSSLWEGESNINNTGGETRLDYSYIHGQSGDVPICTVTLRAIGEPGDISLLNITVDVLVDDTGKDVTSAIRSIPGMFEVLYPDTSDPIRYIDTGGLYKGIRSGNTLYLGEEDLNLTRLGNVKWLVHYSNFSACIVDATIQVPDYHSFNPGNLTAGRYYAWGDSGLLRGRPWVEIQRPHTGLDLLLSGTNTSARDASLTRDTAIDLALENNLEGLHAAPPGIFMDIRVTTPGGGVVTQFGGRDLKGIPINASAIYIRGISLNSTEPGIYTAQAVWPSTSDFARKGYDSNTVSFEITLNATPPVANFTASITNGKAPLTVPFTDTSTGSPTAWFWTFGDGNTSTEQNPTHIYTFPGNHTVTLSIGGNSSTLTKPDYIKVTPVLLGDADGNGRVNQADTLLVLQQVVGLEKKPEDPGSEQFQRIDVHQNGVIDVGDALFIAQYNVGLRNIWFELWG